MPGDRQILDSFEVELLFDGEVKGDVEQQLAGIL